MTTTVFVVMPQELVKNAPKRAMRNRESLDGSCGCFHCLEIFDFSEIKEWTDGGETAICPKCNTDAVLDVPNKELLRVIQNHWFASRS